LAEYRLQTNPARTFLLDTYVEDPEASVPTQAVFERYRDWARDSGYDTLDAGEFGKEVKRAYPKAQRERVSADGKRPYVYLGLRMR
jgi:phage/plasmid-associated DNA primase